jgi:hypothetical protein
MSGNEPGRRGHGHRWLLILPFLGQIGMVPFVNDIAWRPWSLPFPMVWQMMGIVLASIVIAIVFHLDRRIEPDDEDAAPLDGPVH